MKNIEEKIRTLNELMKDPQPGIFSWVEFMKQTVRELNDIVNSDLEPGS